MQVEIYLVWLISQLITMMNSQFCSMLSLTKGELSLKSNNNFAVEVKMDKKTNGSKLSAIGWVKFSEVNPSIRSLMRFANLKENLLTDTKNVRQEVFNIEYDNSVQEKSSIILKLFGTGGSSDHRFNVTLSSAEWYFIAFTSDYASDKVGIFVSNLVDTTIDRKVAASYPDFNIQEKVIIEAGCSYVSESTKPPSGCFNGFIRDYQIIFDYLTDSRYLYLLTIPQIDSTLYVVDVYDRSLDMGYAKNNNNKTFKIVAKDSTLIEGNKISSGDIPLLKNTDNLVTLMDKSSVGSTDKESSLVNQEKPISGTNAVAEILPNKHQETTSNTSQLKPTDAGPVSNKNPEISTKSIENRDTISMIDPASLRDQKTKTQTGVSESISPDTDERSFLNLRNNNNNQNGAVNEAKTHDHQIVVSNEQKISKPAPSNSHNKNIESNNDLNVGNTDQSRKPLLVNNIILDNKQLEHERNDINLTPKDGFIEIAPNKAAISTTPPIYNKNNNDFNTFSASIQPSTSKNTFKNEDVLSANDTLANNTKPLLRDSDFLNNQITTKSSNSDLKLLNGNKITNSDNNSSNLTSENIRNNIIKASEGRSDIDNNTKNLNIVNRHDSQRNSDTRQNFKPSDTENLSLNNKPNDSSALSSYSSFGRSRNLNARSHDRFLIEVLDTDDDNATFKDVTPYKPFSKTLFKDGKHVLIKDIITLNSGSFLTATTFYLKLRYKESLGDSYRLLSIQTSNRETFLYVNLRLAGTNRYVVAEAPILKLSISSAPVYKEDNLVELAISIIQLQNKAALLIYCQGAFVASEFVINDLNAAYDLIVFDPLYSQRGLIELYSLHILTSPSAFVYKSFKNTKEISQCNEKCNLPFFANDQSVSCLKCQPQFTLVTNTQNCQHHCSSGFRNIQGICFQCTDDKCSELETEYFKPKWIGGSNIMVHQVKKIENFNGNYTNLFSVSVPLYPYFNYTTTNFPNNNSAIYSFDFMFGASYHDREVIFKLNPESILFDSNKDQLQNLEYKTSFGAVDGVLLYRSERVEYRLKILSLICYCLFIVTMIFGVIGSYWRCSLEGYHKFMYQKTLQSFLMFQYFTFWSFYNSNIPYNAKSFLNGFFRYSVSWHGVFTSVARDNYKDHQEYLGMIDKRILGIFADLGVSNSFILSFGLIFIIQGCSYLSYLLIRPCYRESQSSKQLEIKQITQFKRFVNYVVTQFELKTLVTTITLFTVETTILAVYNFYSPNFEHSLFTASFVFAILWVILLSTLIFYVLAYPFKTSTVLRNSAINDRHGYLYDGLHLDGIKKNFQGIQYLHYLLYSVIIVVAYRYRVVQILVNMFLLLVLVVYIILVRPAELEFDQFEQIGIYFIAFVAKLFLTILIIDDTINYMGEFTRWVLGYFVVIFIFLAVVWNLFIVSYKLFVHGYRCTDHARTASSKFGYSKNIIIQKPDVSSMASDGKIDTAERDRSRLINIEKLKELLSATNTLNSSTKKREDLQQIGFSNDNNSVKDVWISKQIKNKSMSVMQSLPKIETSKSDNNQTILYTDRNKTDSKFKDSERDVSENDREITFQARSLRYNNYDEIPTNNRLILNDSNSTIVKSDDGYNKRSNILGDAQRSGIQQTPPRNTQEMQNAIKNYLQKEDLLHNHRKPNAIKKDTRRLSVDRSPSEVRSFFPNTYKMSNFRKVNERVSNKERTPVPNKTIKTTFNRSVDVKIKSPKPKLRGDSTRLIDFNMSDELEQQHLSAIKHKNRNKKNNGTEVLVNEELATFLEKNFAYGSGLN